MFYDNTYVVNISKNHVQQSQTKHVDIRHHFIRNLFESLIISQEHTSRENQLVVFFTKPLDGLTFEFLRKTIGISITP